MIDDRWIWACAIAIERRYGDGASRHVAGRIGTLAAAVDEAGARTWRRIGAALDLLSTVAAIN